MTTWHVYSGREWHFIGASSQIQYIPPTRHHSHSHTHTLVIRLKLTRSNTHFYPLALTHGKKEKEREIYKEK